MIDGRCLSRHFTPSGHGLSAAYSMVQLRVHTPGGNTADTPTVCGRFVATRTPTQAGQNRLRSTDSRAVLATGACRFMK